jgi:hypothetical protein
MQTTKDASWRQTITESSFNVKRQAFSAQKRAPEGSGAMREDAREMRSSESLKPERIYLLSAMGLAPKSRRLFTAVRAARTLGIPAAAAP